MPAHLKLEAPWVDVKERLKEINLSLSDDDLEFIPGEEEALLERLSGKLNLNKEEVQKWIESVSFNKGKAS